MEHVRIWYAYDKEKTFSHIVTGEAFSSADYAICGANVLKMSMDRNPPKDLRMCGDCILKRLSTVKPEILMPSQPPPTIERLQSTEEMLMMTLFKSWSNRIDREIEILKLQQVDKSKLEGLADLVGEIKEASDSMANAWMIAKFGNINNP